MVSAFAVLLPIVGLSLHFIDAGGYGKSIFSFHGFLHKFLSPSLPFSVHGQAKDRLNNEATFGSCVDQLGNVSEVLHVVSV